MSISFKKFRIGELFDVSTGSSIKTSITSAGPIPRVSVRGDRNGVLGYFDTEKLHSARHSENFISVNFFGVAFYHPYKASLEMKVHCLKLKSQELTEPIGLYLVAVLNKVFAQLGYCYGEQLSSGDLKKQELYISLPVDSNGDPDWDYMQSYVEELEKSYVEDLQRYIVAKKRK